MKINEVTYQDSYENMQSAVRYLEKSIEEMRKGFKADKEVVDCVDDIEEILSPLANAVNQLGEELENLNC